MITLILSIAALILAVVVVKRMQRLNYELLALLVWKYGLPLDNGEDGR